MCGLCACKPIFSIAPHDARALPRHDHSSKLAAADFDKQATIETEKEYTFGRFCFDPTGLILNEHSHFIDQPGFAPVCLTNAEPQSAISRKKIEHLHLDE